MHVQLAAASSLQAASAALFAWIGAVNLRRHAHDPPAQRAVRHFACWWFGLAGYTALSALGGLLAAFDVTAAAVHVPILALSYAPLCLALWGLLSYLLYIYSGTHRFERALLAYHAALALSLAVLLAYTRPTSVVADGWGARIDYANAIAGPALALLVVAILGPVLAGAIAYGALYPRTTDPAAKRRILVVSATLIVWFGFSIAARGASNDLPWWPLTARIMALSATVPLVIAFRR